MPFADASTVASATGAPSRDMRAAACPLISIQASVTPFQKCGATAVTKVATRFRPETGTRAARTIPPPSACLVIHQHEPARQRARELANTPAFARAQRQRKKVEALFAELKNQIGLRRLRLRRLKFVREQFFLAAAAQNLKRLVRFLTQPTRPVLEATA